MDPVRHRLVTHGLEITRPITNIRTKRSKHPWSFNRLKLDLLMIENGARFVAAGLMASVLKGRNAAELTLPCM